MNKIEHENYARKVLNVLGIERIKNLHKLQEQSLNNQLQDLVEKHNNVIETITDEEIMGRYELVTKYIYPSDFIEMSEILKQNDPT
jgi:hypothetical protein